MEIITEYQNIIIIFAAFVVLHFMIKFILQKIAKLTTKTKSNLDDYIIKNITTPVRVFAWIFFLYIVLQELGLAKHYQYVDALFAINSIWIILKILSSVEFYLINDSDKFDNDIVSLMMKLVKIIVIFVAVLTIMQFFGFDISSILTFGGVGGMVIGLAAKDMLANIFGGLMISLDRPFSVGDWIRVGDVEGTVEQIGWRMTIVRTFSKNPIYVPNSNFSTKHIETPSRMTNRRIREIIGLRYDDIEVLPKIREEIENYLKNHNDIDKKALTMVYFNHFNDSSLDLVVYTFTSTTNWEEYQKVKGGVLLDIADIIAKNDADIAYPTTTLKLDK
jgi:MscS family membrane protein